ELHGRLLAQRGDVDLATQRGRRVADRDLAGQVRAAPLEDRVRAHQHLAIEVARRAAGPPGLALAAEPDPVAAVGAAPDLDRKGLGFAHAPLAVAGLAGILDDGALAPALRTGLLDGEKALLHAHRAAAAAGPAAARRGARLRTAAVTGGAL